jgi:hypothetical protein
MTTYRVKWTIDIEADFPEEAARLARNIQLNPHSTATIFDVSWNKQESIANTGKRIANCKKRVDLPL